MSSDNDKNLNLGERLIILESLLHLNPTKIASIGGISRSTYYRYRNGKSTPKVEFLNRIINHNQSINGKWLLEGNGNPLNENDESEDSDELSISATESNHQFYDFPLYRMSPANKQSDTLNVKESFSPLDSILLSKSFIKLFVDEADVSDAFAMVVDGDSMYPDIRANGVILVNRNQLEPDSDGIFIVRYDDFIRMKLIQPVPGNKLVLSTLNSKFKSITVDEDTDDFEILGKIIWTANSI